MSSAREVAAATAEALERTGAAGLNATLHWSRELLEREAVHAEQVRRAGGTGSALYGYAIAVKDNIVTTEQPTTCQMTRP